MIHIATGADEVYAPGLWITVVSLLRALSFSEEVTLHILDGGLKADSIKKLRSVVSKIRPECILSIHSIDHTRLKAWNPGPHDPLMAYARLLLGSLVDADKVIYLDSDMIVVSDLAELWNKPMDGKLALVCRGGEDAMLKEDCPWKLSITEEELPYFNSGLILLDLAQWRACNMEKQVTALLAGEKVVCRFWDQTILNYLLRYQIALLPMTWNWQGRITTQAQASAVKMIHFITPKKPWFWWSGDLRFRLWRSFYRASIGSPLKLFLSRSALHGLFFGTFEIVIRRYSWLRAIYVRSLIISVAWKKNNSSAEITKHYYTEGLGSKSGDVEFKRDQPALKILQQRVALKKLSNDSLSNSI